VYQGCLLFFLVLSSADVRHLPIRPLVQVRSLCPGLQHSADSERPDQWPGMCIVSFVGYAVSEYTLALGSEASSILAACAISVSGKPTVLYSTVYFALFHKCIQYCTAL